jgi:nucleoside-diphosphate-sugar epimerase
MMRVLVLGADGFVGTRVVAALAASDWAAPVAGSRRATGSGERIVLDATDRDAVARALEGIDAVVNCIAGDAATIENNATALFAAAGPRRIVHLSSMAVYGSATGRLTEEAPLLADTGAYAAAKAAAEVAAAQAANVVLLRPGCIYGAGSTQWSLRIASLLAHRRIGDLGAGGDACSNIVHVDDVVQAALLALRTGEAGRAYNLAMPGAPDWNGYFLNFARALGTVPIRRIPGWQLKLEKLAAIPLKLAEKATHRLPPPIPPSLIRFWRQDATLDPTRASTELGVRWTPLDAGLADAAQWCAGRLRLRKAS